MGVDDGISYIKRRCSSIALFFFDIVLSIEDFSEKVEQNQMRKSD
jgi:hypothetical protein